MNISTETLNQITAYLRDERVEQTVAIEPIVYENAAVHGIVGTWDVGHVEVRWTDNEGLLCVAHFTGRAAPSFVRRRSSGMAA